MRSSTSNSSSRIRGKLGGRSWLLGFLVLACCELGLRGLGYRPALHDSKAFWAEQRERVSLLGDKGVALLGASRMQRGIVPEELAPYFPGKQVVMLAIDGYPPLATLEDLAEDSQFTGTVICDLDTSRMLLSTWNLQAQRTYIDYYKTQWSLFDWLKLQLNLSAQRQFVLLHERFSIASLTSPRSEVRYRAHLVLRRNRFEEAHYNWMTPETQRTAGNVSYAHYKSFYQNTPFPTPEEMDGHYNHIESLVRTLRAKGSRVILVRLPTSGNIWELDQQFLPKNLYWDRFARKTEAETIHFADYVSLSVFNCPEGSHLEYVDSVRFTQALGELLARPSAK